ncbi:hypothetical protein SAMN02910275_01080 [Butyrivibrio sp. INlla18]|uniref:hypothetical protein n=1 Tax=unclassified Butyrivibrio TaxID=2639466 RepID=UPI000891F6E4|nr:MULTISPECIES: hypothetical protein [unclassified Butyrivibrio]MBE5842482.1 hypothetical protein [Butyrivibrio sp.]MCR4756407.1 hypothetical protein [Butyrivibrio sp.]SDA53692.1 hypothetical protein SAMN02910275_01080 [Butyrivibrio sp. INlla18]
MSNIQFYNLMSIIMAAMSLIMLALAIIMWVKLDIKHYISVLTGSEAKKSIEKIRENAQKGGVHADLFGKDNKAKISWNTSEGLSSTTTETLFKNLEDQALKDKSYATTELLSSSDYATTVLEAIKDSEFVVEREIVNKG